MLIPDFTARGISGNLFEFLEEKYYYYNRPEFVESDPISIPHRYTRRQDIEIMGFWAAVLSWGQRKTIINKCLELSGSMDHAPYDFIKNHEESDLKRFLHFKHRTFNPTDALYFIHFFRDFFAGNDSLEEAFVPPVEVPTLTIEPNLIAFHDRFCGMDSFPERTRKHIATPRRKSSCKRLNMFLRWMVRSDNRGVDFGIWKKITPAQLVCPCDVHVDRVARKLGLIVRPGTDWQTALQLTENLRLLDASDPVKYDFALFGLGIEGFAN